MLRFTFIIIYYYLLFNTLLYSKALEKVYFTDFYGFNSEELGKSYPYTIYFN